MRMRALFSRSVHLVSFNPAMRNRFAIRNKSRFLLALAASIIALPPQNVPLANARPAGLAAEFITAPAALQLAAPQAGFDEANLHIKADPHALDAPFEESVARQPFGGLAFAAVEEFSRPGVLRYGDNVIRLPFDEANGVYAFGPMRLKGELVATIVRAAFIAGVDPRLLMAIADKESSFVVRARASTSSATGLFQFIDATWLKALRDFGGNFALDSEAQAAADIVQGDDANPPGANRARLLALRNDPFLSTLMAAAMLRHEQEKLEAKFGRAITGAEVYLVHFLGPGGARKFLSALEETPTAAASQLLPAAARANRPIFFESRWVKAKPATKISSKRSSSKAATKSSPKLMLVAQSLSVEEVHEKIETSLERRLSRYSALDFGAAPPDVWSSESGYGDSGFWKSSGGRASLSGDGAGSGPAIFALRMRGNL